MFCLNYSYSCLHQPTISHSWASHSWTTVIWSFRLLREEENLLFWVMCALASQHAHSVFSIRPFWVTDGDSDFEFITPANVVWHGFRNLKTAWEKNVLKCQVWGTIKSNSPLIVLFFYCKGNFFHNSFSGKKRNLVLTFLHYPENDLENFEPTVECSEECLSTEPWAQSALPPPSALKHKTTIKMALVDLWLSCLKV